MHFSPMINPGINLQQDQHLQITHWSTRAGGFDKSQKKQKRKIKNQENKQRNMGQGAEVQIRRLRRIALTCPKTLCLGEKGTKTPRLT